MPVQGRLKIKHEQNKDTLPTKFYKILKFQSYLGIKKKTLITSCQMAGLKWLIFINVYSRHENFEQF